MDKHYCRKCGVGIPTQRENWFFNVDSNITKGMFTYCINPKCKEVIEADVNIVFRGELNE